MECMNCGSTNDVIDFIAKGEKLVLCSACRYKLASGKKIVAVRQIGRPTLGVTKKVSLTLRLSSGSISTTTRRGTVRNISGSS